MSHAVQRFFCLSIDVQAYGRTTDLRQAEIQRELVTLLDSAASTAGLARGQWLRQAKGDEELSLIPASEPAALILGAFLPGLAAAVVTHNAAQPPEHRLRLRLGVDDGPVDLAANGFAGRAVVGVSRLVNCAAARRALQLAEGGVMAVALANVVFRDWIASERCALRPDWFRRVRVEEKEVSEDAWLWVPGVDIHSLPLHPTDEPPGADHGGAASQSVTNTFHSPVTFNGGSPVIGINNE
jgi:hypothetical protein